MSVSVPLITNMALSWITDLWIIFFHIGIIHSVKHKMLTEIFTNLFHNKQRLIYQPLKMNEYFTQSEFRYMPRTNKQTKKLVWKGIIISQFTEPV